MRLVKGKNIIQQVAEAIAEAERDGETVERVLLTGWEWRKLVRAVGKIKKDSGAIGLMDIGDRFSLPSGVLEQCDGYYLIDGIKVEREKNV